MREHMGLYRGKRKDNGEWVQGSLVLWEDGSASINISTVAPMYAVDPDTVGECTGLTDKNGKLIFEGDIIKYHEPFVMKATGVVCFGQHQWSGNSNVGFYMKWVIAELPDILRTDLGFWCNERDVVVIGNVHDNPELLGGGDNG